jgi:uncharacterized membrane protein
MEYSFRYLDLRVASVFLPSATFVTLHTVNGDEVPHCPIASSSAAIQCKYNQSIDRTGKNAVKSFGNVKVELHQAEERLLTELRTLRRGVRGIQANSQATKFQLTIGQRIADTVASTMGSWTFIIIQSVILMFWIALNVTAYVQQWDPYPFILLNLALSFQAAYAAPFIMMSQNRQQDIDRKSAEDDFKINIKAELEIELLHQKIDQLRETEVLDLTAAVKELTALLRTAKS